MPNVGDKRLAPVERDGGFDDALPALCKREFREAQREVCFFDLEVGVGELRRQGDISV